LKKRLFTILPPLTVMFIASATIIFSFLELKLTNQNADSTPKVCFNNYCFRVELAKTDEARARGLMYRQNLPADQGMLFIFEKQDRYSFWMKNTLIPLDMIWINQDLKVVFISPNNAPCAAEFCPTIDAPSPAKYVLELNAGTSEKINLKIGDQVSFNQ